VLYVNPAAQQLLPDAGLRTGIPAFPALARCLRDPIAVSLPLSPVDLAQASCDSERPPGVHLYRFGEDGEGWMRIESTPIPASRGRASGYSLRMRDETALHSAMDAVQEQAALLAATLAATRDALFVSELDGTIRYFNERCRELLGLPETVRPGAHVDVLRETLPSLLADVEAFEERLADVLEDPLREALDEYALSDGRIIEVAWQPLVRQGMLRGRIWRIRDLSEQRRSEAALRHAQKLESLGVMAGGIAHDFNNLLAVMMGNATLALDEIPKDTIASACLEDVKKAAERAGDLTEQLLAYAGKTELAMEELDLSQLVGDLADLIAVSIPKGVEVHYDLAEDLPAVTGDASQLRQIVMNLILNGAEASGDSDGTVCVESGLELAAPLQEDAPPRSQVVLRVRDTGCGMDEATRAQIFDPFFSTKFTGRGLGLAASLGIVRSHRGSLSVESEPGRGSTFTVRLPCREGPARRTPGGAPPLSWRGRGTVLVVDDDDGVRTMASRILRSAGLTVVGAADGVEAVRLYRECGESIDAVLLDVTMPHMGGEQAWRALRELDPNVRVVLSSGYPEREVTRPLAAEESLLFVHKPYVKQALLERIREALGG
jgi:signal transduction histidine kinase